MAVGRLTPSNKCKLGENPLHELGGKPVIHICICLKTLYFRVLSMLIIIFILVMKDLSDYWHNFDMFSHYAAMITLIYISYV